MTSIDEAFKQAAFKLIQAQGAFGYVGTQPAGNMKYVTNARWAEIQKHGLLWQGAKCQKGKGGLWLGSSNYGYESPDLIGMQYYFDTGDDDLRRVIHNASRALRGEKPEPSPMSPFGGFVEDDDDEEPGKQIRTVVQAYWKSKRQEFWAGESTYNSIVRSLGTKWRRETPEDYADPDNRFYLETVLECCKPAVVVIIGESDNADFAKPIVEASGIPNMTCRHLSGGWKGDIAARDDHARKVYSEYLALLERNK